MKLEKGDRVVVNCGIKKGARGTVLDGCYNEYALVGIRFDDKKYGVHSCDGLCENGRGCWIMAKNLDKLKDETIVIYRKENSVFALDKSTGKKAEAKCSPEDDFDFNVGAKLAFDRLFGIEKKVEEPAENKLPKVGTRIKIIDAGCGAYGANNKIGVVVADDVESNNGLTTPNTYFKVKLEDGVVWKISKKATYNILKSVLNCKFCVTKKPKLCRLTVGKIYEVKNGRFKDDCGDSFPYGWDIPDMECLENYLHGVNSAVRTTFASMPVEFVVVVD